MEQETKRAMSIDCNVDIGGVVQNLTFNPSKNFAEGNVVLFGITVRQQGRRLIIIAKIYEDERRDEIIGKLGIMVNIMMDLTANDRSIIDTAHIVDQRDILEQISKHKVAADELALGITQEQDITVETLDLITGEMVPVEFSMKLLTVDKEKMNSGKVGKEKIQKKKNKKK